MFGWDKVNDSEKHFSEKEDVSKPKDSFWVITL